MYGMVFFISIARFAYLPKTRAKLTEFQKYLADSKLTKIIQTIEVIVSDFGVLFIFVFYL